MLGLVVFLALLRGGLLTLIVAYGLWLYAVIVLAVSAVVLATVAVSGAVTEDEDEY